MGILRSNSIRLFSYVSLSVFVFLLWFTLWFDDHVQYDGPVHMKIGHKYDVNNTFTDPDLNPALNTFRCFRLALNDQGEMTRARNYLRRHKNTFHSRPDSHYIDMTENCEEFIKSRGYFYKAPSTEERTFPVAYNILFYKNVEQFERLLRSIYRPQNQYCVHVDAKCSDDVQNAVKSITDCFPNVFIASKLEIVIYASYTRLTAEINCMKDHIERQYKWDYLINMAASEFPVLTNMQTIQMLKELRGANDIHEVFKTVDKQRYEKKHFTYIDLRTKTGYMIHTNDKKDPPPSKLVITKGNAYNVFSRKFVEYVLNNDVARQFLAWSADTYTPDEHYWATLNNLYNNSFLDTPGGYKGDPEKKPFFGRYIGWNTSEHAERCKAGHFIHNVCIFSIQDLPMLTSRHELIANKFDLEYDPIVYKCMEEWILTKTLNRTENKFTRLYKKIAPYSNLPNS